MESDNVSSVRVLHQSVVLLGLKGAIAWIFTTILFLGFEYFLSAVHTVAVTPSLFNRTFDVSSLFTYVTSANLLIHILMLFIYGWLIMFIVFQWIYNVYIIEPKHVITRRGIVFTIEDRFNMQAMQAIEVKQGLLGKLFNYGTLRLYNPELEKEVTLYQISNPYKEANFIKQFCPTIDMIHGISKAH